jgi:hypothetical protein
MLDNGATCSIREVVPMVGKVTGKMDQEDNKPPSFTNPKPLA